MKLVRHFELRTVSVTVFEKTELIRYPATALSVGLVVLPRPDESRKEQKWFSISSIRRSFVLPALCEIG